MNKDCIFCETKLKNPLLSFVILTNYQNHFLLTATNDAGILQIHDKGECSMKSVLIRLREASSTFSAAEKTIASYILQYPEEAMHLSVHALAEKGFSSPATVVRMCRRIDFDGYREFRQALTYEMAVRQTNTEKNSQEIIHSDGIEDLIEKITFRNIVSLEDTKNLLDPETLQKCVDLLCSCKTICYKTQRAR